jgi:hypothetical protein
MAKPMVVTPPCAACGIPAAHIGLVAPGVDVVVAGAADFTDRRFLGSASDLRFHVTYMFATAKSKDQRGRGGSLAGSVGPPSLVAGGRGGHRGPGRLTSPGRSQKQLAGRGGRSQVRSVKQTMRVLRRLLAMRAAHAGPARAVPSWASLATWWTVTVAL